MIIRNNHINFKLFELFGFVELWYSLYAPVALRHNTDFHKSQAIEIEMASYKDFCKHRLKIKNVK